MSDPERATTVSDAAPADCMTCGVCCFSTLDRYIQVDGADYNRLGDDAEALVHFIENRAYMRLVDGHCAALDVDREGRRFVCTVYERRPRICRDLERGSPACAGERATKGDRPAALITLTSGPSRLA
jgi:Fe-S-cluster containining protein